MAKDRSKFICVECGYEVSKWMGRCPGCNKWNTIIEEAYEGIDETAANAAPAVLKSFNDIKTDTKPRIHSGINEMDRVLGGGFVKGSLILVGGDPGIGKSTLMLQICQTVITDEPVYYITGEESASQIKIRGKRLGVKREGIYISAETSFDRIESLIVKNKPGISIIDSIQTMHCTGLSSAPGSVSQVREITSRLMKVSKKHNIIVIIIGHVTKEGAIAGPRVLEHMVDTVLYFEGDRHLSYRILRAVKNRFGSTDEIGIFEMKNQGLIEVENPSAQMLSSRNNEAPGSIVTAVMEGTRPMLVELQALVCPTAFNMPRRMANGVDAGRMTMLMAVLEKIVGYRLYNFDAYINAAGGIRLIEPGCDLGILTAAASSYKNITVDKNTVVAGEVGLSGELRGIRGMEQRVIEAARQGFKTFILPKSNLSTVEKRQINNDISLIGVQSVQKALELMGF